MSRRDKRKAVSKARAKASAATGRAWTKVQRGLVIDRATYRGRVVFTLGGKVR